MQFCWSLIYYFSLTSLSVCREQARRTTVICPLSRGGRNYKPSSMILTRTSRKRWIRGKSSSSCHAGNSISLSFYQIPHHYAPNVNIIVLIPFMKMATKNIHQRTFFLWLRWDVNELKLISDDKNNDEMYAASSLSRRDFWGLPDIQNTSYRLS